MRGGGRFGSDYKRRLAADMAKKKTEKFSSPPPAERQPSVFNRIVEGVKTAARIGEESFYPTYGQVGSPNPLAVFGSPTFRRTGIGQSLARSEIGRRLIQSQANIGEAAGGYTGPVSTVSRGVSEPSPVNIALAGLTLGEFLPGGRGAKAVKQSVRQSTKLGITPFPSRAGVSLEKELDRAYSRLDSEEWVPGHTTEFDTVSATVDKINWGPYQRPVSKRVSGDADITKVNLEDMTTEETKRFSPEELQLLENIDALRMIDRQTDAAFRGSAEPVRVRVQKYPKWEEFRSRLTGERLGGIPVERKRELYEETLRLIDDTGGYWSVKKIELGKKPVSIGGMDMAHIQHFKKGGRGTTSSGDINVEAQQAGLNRKQQAEGIGGSEGFGNWWKINEDKASNRAIIEALYFDRF